VSSSESLELLPSEPAKKMSSFLFESSDSYLFYIFESL
jgi:hypothetical protein